MNLKNMRGAFLKSQ